MRHHMKLNVGRNSLAIMNHTRKISRPASFRRTVLDFRESFRVTSELPTFSSIVCNKNVNAVQDLRFPQRFCRGFWSLMLYRWVSVSRSFEEMWCFLLQKLRDPNSLQDVGSFKTPGNTTPTKQHHTQDLNHHYNYTLIFDTSVNIMYRKKQNEDVIPGRTVSNLKVLMQNERK